MLKGCLSPVTLKEIFQKRSENFEIKSICTCVENHARLTGWQKLLRGRSGGEGGRVRLELGLGLGVGVGLGLGLG